MRIDNNYQQISINRDFSINKLHAEQFAEQWDQINKLDAKEYDPVTQGVVKLFANNACRHRGHKCDSADRLHPYQAGDREGQEEGHSGGCGNKAAPYTHYSNSDHGCALPHSARMGRGPGSSDPARPRGCGRAYYLNAAYTFPDTGGLRRVRKTEGKAWRAEKDLTSRSQKAGT